MSQNNEKTLLVFSACRHGARYPLEYKENKKKEG